MHTIKNDLLSISVLEKGAELCSIKSLQSGNEYIWQADPDVWASHAPNLFPVIGCLKNGSYTFKGKTYQIPKHGIVRNNENIELIPTSENELCFRLRYDENTLKIYPFKFEFLIHFILKKNSIQVKHTVRNEDIEPMFFSLGGHPAFNCPFNERESYKNMCLEFEKNETKPIWEVLNNGLIGTKNYPYLENSNNIQLTKKLFENDALIFKNLKSNTVNLKSTESGSQIKFEFTDFPYMAFWAKPAANYICIEPWLGIADSESHDGNFETKEGIIKLQGKSDFVASYTISIIE